MVRVLGGGIRDVGRKIFQPSNLRLAPHNSGLAEVMKSLVTNKAEFRCHTFLANLSQIVCPMA